MILPATSFDSKYSIFDTTVINLPLFCPNLQRQNMPQQLKMFSLVLLFLLGSLASATASILEDASKYAVRIKTSISYPFFEDEAGVSNGAGFLVDKDRGWIITNAHVSGEVQVLWKFCSRIMIFKLKLSMSTQNLIFPFLPLRTSLILH